MTLIGDSLHDLARQYMGLVAYPPHLAGDPDRRKRELFVSALRHRLARRVSPDRRPPELHYPPRARELDSWARKGHRRCAHAVGAAWMAVCASARTAGDPDWERDGVTYAALRLAEIVKERVRGIEGESGEPAYMLRRWKRTRPTLHLALPLLTLRFPAGSWSIWPHAAKLITSFPMGSFEDCEVDPIWVEPALYAAAVWREALPQMGLGINSDQLVEVVHFYSPTMGDSGHQ